MNKLMTIVAATLTVAAFAQESAAPAPQPPSAKPTAAARMPRPRMDRAMHDAAMGMDPVVRAIMNPQIAEKLGLSDDQKAKIKALRAQPGATRELQAKVRKSMERQNELLHADAIDEAAVMAAIDERFEVQKQIAKAQVKRIIEAKAILTPEQAQKAMDAMKEMRASRRRPPAPTPKSAPEAPAKEAPAK